LDGGKYSKEGVVNRLCERKGFDDIPAEDRGNMNRPVAERRTEMIQQGTNPEYAPQINGYCPIR
jgi:hypothetical protein